MLIPNKHCGFMADGTRRAHIDTGGGGGGGTQQSTSYTTNVPEYAKEPFMEMIGKGVALSEAPYQAYGGERVSQFTPLQRQAFSQAETQQVAPQLGAATGVTGLAALQGLNAQFNPFQTGQFTGQTAQQYMNPFMQNVVDIQQREAQRRSEIGRTQDQARAVQSGAFGGSRQAIVEAERQRNLAQQLGDIQATGSQAAFQAAQDQFNREQQMREQSRQFGAGFGMEGLRTALSGAGQLGQLGQQQFGQEMDIMGARQQMGGTQQQQIQRILDQQFADFQQQRDFPYQQLGFLSDLLRGTGASSRTIYNVPQPSALQTVAGLGTAAAGFGGFGRAEGGSIPSSYAEGGITSLLGDQQLAQTAQSREQSPMMQLAAAEEAQQRAMLRSAAPAEMPEMSDMTEEELLAALQSAIQQGDETKARVIAELIEDRKMPESGIAMIAPESVGEVPEGGIMGMYGGGAVAFRTGDEVLSPYERSLEKQREEDRQRIRDLASGLGGQLEKSGAAIADIGMLPIRGVTGAYDTAVVRPLRALGADAAYLSPLLVPEGADPSSMTPFYDRIRGREDRQTRVAAPAGGGRGIEAGPTAEDMAKAHQQNPRMMAGLPALEKAPAADAAAGNVATPGGSGSGVMSESQLMAMARRFGIDPKAAAERQTALAKQQADARERGVSEREAALEAFIKQRGVYGKEQEAEARQEIEGLAGKKLDAKNFSLIQAGLAILSADPSRGAFAAIGEGAAKGLMGYKGDLDKLEEKREKITGRIDRILELRRLESTADGKDRKALKNERSKLEELAIQDNREIMAGLDKDEANLGTVLLNAQLRQRESALNRASRTTDSLALQRLNLQALTGRRILLRDQLKAAKEDGNEAEVTRLNSELSSVDAALAEKSGQAAPSANMSGWGKAIVE